MGTNTLIAFCVGAMFALAVIVVIGSFADRRHSRQVLARAVVGDGENTIVIPPHGYPQREEPDT